MKIGELAKSAGVSPSKVRFYEARGLLPSAARQDNGYRSYGAADLKRLLLIRRAQSLGFTLDQISGFLALSNEERKAKKGVVEAAEAKLVEIDHLLSDLHERRGQIAEFIEELRARRLPATDG